ncbi:uncharacterized protein [Nicotiana sylvestris]|uniref:uncharacterized protein n=1 Tax=Nicotiana sylvestris TaxID=4096 RepID=UPI00388C8F08
MNDIVHTSLKINLISTDMMKGIVHTEQLMHDYHTEADNWKEQFESLQLEMEILEENKCTLEQQVKVFAVELAIERASSNQDGKDKNLLMSSEQLSKANEDIRGLKDLLNQKEVYSGELVQMLTNAQEDLRDSYDDALTEKEELKNEIKHWERDYEALEHKAAVEVSWAFLNTRHDTLMEASREFFDLTAEIGKIKETIEKTQQS